MENSERGFGIAKKRPDSVSKDRSRSGRSVSSKQSLFFNSGSPHIACTLSLYPHLGRGGFHVPTVTYSSSNTFHACLWVVFISVVVQKEANLDSTLPHHLIPSYCREQIKETNRQVFGERERVSLSHNQMRKPCMQYYRSYRRVLIMPEMMAQ